MNSHKSLELLKSKTIFSLIAVGAGYSLITTMSLNILYFLNSKWMLEYGKHFSELIGDGTFFEKIILVCFIAPVIEEILFRGTVFRILKRYLPLLWANLIQALLFAISHNNIVQGIYVFLLGLIVGYVYTKYETVFATILIHMSYNIIGYLFPKILTIYLLPQINNIWEACIILICVLGIGIFMFAKSFRQIKNYMPIKRPLLP